MADPTAPTAPPGRQLYVSLSGTDRDDWQQQLALYGALIFAGGFILGRALAKKPAPRLPRSTVRLSPGMRMKMLQARSR